MCILISWLHQKPADLDLHCFQILTLCLQCAYYVEYGNNFSQIFHEYQFYLPLCSVPSYLFSVSTLGMQVCNHLAIHFCVCLSKCTLAFTVVFVFITVKALVVLQS